MYVSLRYLSLSKSEYFVGIVRVGISFEILRINIIYFYMNRMRQNLAIKDIILKIGAVILVSLKQNI